MLEAHPGLDLVMQAIAFLAAGLAMVWKVSRIATAVELRIASMERSLERYLERLDDVVQRLARLEGRSYQYGDQDQHTS